MLNARSFKDIKLFIKNGHNINEQDLGGSTALHKAVIHNDIQLVIDLLDNGADPNISNILQESPIFYIKSEEMATALFNKTGPGILCFTNKNNKNAMSTNKFVRNYILKYQI